jgi:hypothetical protein
MGVIKTRIERLERLAGPEAVPVGRVVDATGRSLLLLPCGPGVGPVERQRTLVLSDGREVSVTVADWRNEPAHLREYFDGISDAQRSQGQE